MAWTALGCLNNFINSIVWNHNAINWAPVWCDICKQCHSIFYRSQLTRSKATRITIGLSVAIPAASLCINRRLYLIASVKSVTITKAEKRRAILVDLAIGLGIPLLQMILRMLISEFVNG